MCPHRTAVTGKPKGASFGLIWEMHMPHALAKVMLNYIISLLKHRS